MAKILSSKAFIERKKEELLARCNVIKSQKIQPYLAVVLVGSNPASLSYVRNKKKFCQDIGATCEILELSENISPKEFRDQINALNNNDLIHGIIIQLPLPDKLHTLQLQELIDHAKDVDGFHPQTTLDFYYQHEASLLPCTPAGIMTFLKEEIKVSFSDKLVCLIGRSLIVGKPMLHLLNNADATVIWCHSKTKNIRELTRIADIIISATGKRMFLDASYFSNSKEQIIVDVGISGGQGMTLAGDLNVPSIQNLENISYTPVPGGVGPLTVYKLVENLITACEKRLLTKNKLI